MKPQSLQEAIKANALKKKDRFTKGEWKEPVVKKHQITAEDIAAEKAKGKGGIGAAIAGGGGGASAAETMALKNELAMLREEMRSNIRQLKEEQKKAVEAAEAAGKLALAAAPSAAAARAPAPVVDNSYKEETAALKNELNSLKTELTTMRTKLAKAVDSIPADLKDLREELRQIQEDTANARSAPPPPPPPSSNGASHGEADAALVKEVRKTKSEIKELRMMVSQSQDGTSLAKELRVIVDQQETTLETHAEEIEELKEQVRVLKRRLETAEFTAKEAMELAKKKSAPTTVSAASPPSSPVPQVIPLSPTNKPRRNGASNTKNGSNSPGAGESSPSSVKSLEEDDKKKQKAKQNALYDEATGETKLELLHLDSDDEESTDGSDLYPAKNTPAPNDRLLSRTGSKQGGANGGSRNTPSRTFSPSSIVLDKDGGYSYKATADDDEDDDEDDDSEDSDDDVNRSPKGNRKANSSPISTGKSPESKDMRKAMPRATSFDDDVGHLPGPSKSSAASSPRAPAKRRGDPSSDGEDDGSTTTSDDSDTVPKKKTVSLLPHRSDTLYQEQRKDPVLRKFIVEAKSADMTVHKVHGKNLVFFSGKVYIPASLRQQTMQYYIKKHSYNPLVAMQKHCFWPDIEDDMKKCQNKGGDRWRVEVVVKEEIRT
ncbi:hypothetical protein ACA910_006939 [Epithemia clementina (nom. ined.)]